MSRLFPKLFYGWLSNLDIYSDHGQNLGHTVSAFGDMGAGWGDAGETSVFAKIIPTHPWLSSIEILS